MAVYWVARFEVRPESRAAAERAMHELASYVRKELSDSMWTAYRDPNAPTHYTCFMRADSPAADERHRSAPGTKAFIATLRPLIIGDIETSCCELVTSSDLAPRRRR
jgi:quinol monooxygenase YgiN